MDFLSWLAAFLGLACISIAILALRKQWIKRQWQKTWDAYDHPLHLDYYDDLIQQAMDDERE